MNKSLFLTGLMSAAFCAAWSAPSMAHTHLEKSDPAKNQHLTTAPTSVQLWFSGKMAAEWSKIIVKDAAGTRVDKETVTSDNPKQLSVELEPLSSGNYEVDWNVISGDGHRVKGSYFFSVE